MSGPAVLLIDAEGRAGSALRRALAGMELELRCTASLPEALALHAAAPAALLLLPAGAVDPDDDALAVVLGAGPPADRPAAMLYADDPALLGPRLAGGRFDYLLPPFEDALVRARVATLLRCRPAALGREEAREREELLKLERDLQIGREIQQGFLPASLPQPPGWEITACFHPAREVAGDFYDAFPMVNGRRVGIVIADVCDKGVGAALFMALFRTLVRSNAQHTHSLSWLEGGSGAGGAGEAWLAGGSEAVRRAPPNIGTGALLNAVAGTNDYVAENHMTQGYFVTLFFGVLDPRSGSLIYINGGHNPPLLVRAAGGVEPLPPTGPAVGMLPHVRYRMGQTRLEPGDVLFAYTDGVTDARSPDGAFFGEARLHALVERGMDSAGALVAAIEDELQGHMRGAPRFDDITMLALQRASRVPGDRPAQPD